MQIVEVLTNFVTLKYLLGHELRALYSQLGRAKVNEPSIPIESERRRTKYFVNDNALVGASKAEGGRSQVQENRETEC
ncbi:MAG: hypothetical protein H0U99_01340 [Chthoniobacterales bacterium]|nr:hypothetical protein [Chthoniobacterales bacterium]